MSSKVLELTPESAFEALCALKSAREMLHFRTASHRDATLMAEQSGNPGIAHVATIDLEAARATETDARELVEILTDHILFIEPRKTHLEVLVYEHPEVIEEAKKARAEEARIAEEEKKARAAEAAENLKRERAEARAKRKADKQAAAETATQASTRPTRSGGKTTRKE